jgi:hypothetical protein
VRIKTDEPLTMFKRSSYQYVASSTIVVCNDENIADWMRVAAVADTLLKYSIAL